MCLKRIDRKNGLTWPTNILQVLAIAVLISFSAIHFVLIVQYTYGAFFYLTLTISSVFCGGTVITKTICTLSDPADKSLTKDPKSTYGSQKPPFDRAKQGHVITVDNYCQICTTTVDTSSRHCPQCNKCILRFDHHCDYINNCVGRHNYIYYISLLLCATAFCLIVIANIIYILYHFCFKEKHFFASLGRANPTIFGYDVSSATVISLLVVYLVLTVVVFILVSNLCRLHLYLLWHGWTTWDYYRRPKDERAQHSYWKYNAEQEGRVEFSITEVSSNPTSTTDLELRSTPSHKLPKRLCRVLVPPKNKTSPMPPHSV